MLPMESDSSTKYVLETHLARQPWGERFAASRSITPAKPSPSRIQTPVQPAAVGIEIGPVLSVGT